MYVWVRVGYGWLGSVRDTNNYNYSNNNSLVSKRGYLGLGRKVRGADTPYGDGNKGWTTRG